MRLAARSDQNQARIVQALRKAGASVTHLHTVGRGVADILVSYRQLWLVMEIKASSKSKLTIFEKRWIGEQRAPVYIVTSPLQAVDLLKTLRPI